MTENENKVAAEGFSLEALHAGDPQEFSRLVDAYSSKIYRLAIKMLNQQQDAEDVLQETFLKAYRAIKSFDGRSKISTWLFRIATNEALMIIRRKHPEMISIDEPIETEEGEQEPVQIIDWCCLPEDELLSEETRKKLDAAVQELPERLKVVFILRDINDLSTHETAEVLGLTDTAVKTRLSRARLRLREELSVYFSEKSGGGTELPADEPVVSTHKAPRETASSLKRSS
ncbi:MAG: RNA polymerase subunit sigma-24 [Anaerolineales bacterium]|nr:sigma-70 family RNA polymerase sigma factor [Anaerolineae bacterium]PWB54084.1 MAG: RNA polymerase subunit sigma-24 [Anaerolineales bacterium]